MKSPLSDFLLQKRIEVIGHEVRHDSDHVSNRETYLRERVRAPPSKARKARSTSKMASSQAMGIRFSRRGLRLLTT